MVLYVDGSFIDDVPLKISEAWDIFHVSFSGSKMGPSDDDMIATYFLGLLR